MSTCTPFAAEGSEPRIILASLAPTPESQTPDLSRLPVWRRLVNSTSATLEWLFGLLSMVLGLSLLATIPIVQFLSLGYLLESSGRIARSGRVRDGFVGMPKAAASAVWC